MVELTKFEWNPIELGFEVILLGTFNPDKLGPLWLHKIGVFGEEEANSLNEKYHTENEERSFSTKFLDVKINKEKFKVGVIDLKSYDILFDFVTVICDKLGSSLDDSFYINLFCHFEATDKNRKEKFLNNSIVMNNWDQILEKPSATLIRAEESFKHKDHQHTRTISISRCNRSDLKHPFHISIYNNIQFDITDKNTFDLLTNKLVVNLLNESVNKTNQTLKIFKYNA